MNHSYRLVWNDATPRCIPAPETARGRGRSCASKALAPAALLLGALLAPAAGAQALPTGDQVLAGQAHVSRDGSQMTIRQDTPKAILHWQGFDIGKHSKVEFKQPDTHAIALNRVVSGNASRIDGQLSANGQVWLVNPNGVVFGKDSSVNVGGLVASTLDITNEDFEAHRQVFTRGAAQGGIVHQGKILAGDEGLVALLAPTVHNEGIISARLGNVVLAGGERITLQAGADGRLQVALDQAEVKTLVENRHLIVADGGQVIMTASTADALAGSVVANTGTVQARTLSDKGGRILLLGDMRHGEVMHRGQLDASAPEGGNGGFVETSAAKLYFLAGATTAAPRGQSGNWLIHRKDMVMDASMGSLGTGADILMPSLENTHVTLKATPTGGMGGSIHINAPVRWSRNTLTLEAPGSIHIDAAMTASGTAGLEMNFGGYSASRPVAAVDTGIVVKRHGNAFAGQVNFIGKDGAGASTNHLKINGDEYTILTQLGREASTTGRDLQGMQGNLAGKYALGGDIHAKSSKPFEGGLGFAPIGRDGAPFAGTLEGLGHSIHGLAMHRPDQGDVGLFGAAVNATLRNVALAGGSIEGRSRVGALVGNFGANAGRSQICNVCTTAKVIGTGASTGALVGMAKAEAGGAMAIAMVHNQGVVQGHNMVGGISGSISALGDESVAVITMADVQALVTGNSLVGGVVGLSLAGEGGESIVSNTHAEGTVTGRMHVGGVIGGSRAWGEKSMTSVLGFSGGAAVHGDSRVGGIIGSHHAARHGRAAIHGVNVAGKVRGQKDFAGGLIGENLATDGSMIAISSARSESSVMGRGRIGGLIGGSEVFDGSVVRILSCGAAKAASGMREFVGGLVGLSTTENAATTLITDAFSTGRVNGSAQVGGLVGAIQATRGGSACIEKSRACGEVVGGSDVGGLIGSLQATSGGQASITRTNARGSVVGRSALGALIGHPQEDKGSRWSVCPESRGTGRVRVQ